MGLKFLRAAAAMSGVNGVGMCAFATAKRVAYKMAYTKTKRPEGRMFAA